MCEHTCQHLQSLPYALPPADLLGHTGFPICEDRAALWTRQCLQKAPQSDSRHPTQRTGVVHAKPGVDAVRMVDVLALGQLPHLLPIGKVLQAD